MYIYTIRLETREQGEKITEVLTEAEEEGAIGFPFSAHLSEELADSDEWYRAGRNG